MPLCYGITLFVSACLLAMVSTLTVLPITIDHRNR